MEPVRRWYAVYCKHRHERAAAERLASRGFPIYLPEYHTRVKWGARQREVKKNLMPGYLFVQAKMDVGNYVRVLQTPSVVKLVGNAWPRLSWIPEEQMESMRLVLESREKFEEVAYWRVGDQIEVVAGPLAGLRGLYAGEGNHKGSVIVSIDLLQRSVSVAVNAADLRLVSALRAAS